ncbi:MAG: MBOAT family O-acyltransferase, partial [Acetobacteraceae bacterium]
MKRRLQSMLFNSHEFLFLFFPLALIAFHFLHRYGEQAQIAALLSVSLLFYASWDVRFLLLLGGSILGNYAIGRSLDATVERGNGRRANQLLTVGVSLDLLVLGCFKYAHFVVDNVNSVSGTNFTLERIILPLGISFFTFEQIGYLVDIRRGRIYHTDLLRYAVFVSFFPRLVAGPIRRYSEILPQLAEGRRPRDSLEDLAVGLTMFAIGLVKKTLLADGIAPFAGPVFTAAAQGTPIDLLPAWGAALAYTCQLYFDFSGYSDMAIGAARCFGIRFPANFNSPYKSTSIIEFWRRWHITLSRFLRDYLYIPLGGNRRGRVRRYVNLMVTMLLGGLWHGANWTFVAWGGLHGLYL